MRILRDYVVVKVPSIFFDEQLYKGVDGKKLLLDVTYNPERHVRNFGEVVSVPMEISSTPLMADTTNGSKPAYTDNHIWSFKTAADIKMEINVGDRVYFHYNCLLPDNMGEDLFSIYHLKSDYRMVDGVRVWDHYYRVKYELIFAAIRFEKANQVSKDFDWSMEESLKPWKERDVFVYTDRFGFDNIYRKKVIPIGSYVFVEVDKETWEDISIPTPETIDGRVLIDKNGRPVLKPKDKWIVKKSAPSRKYLVGWIKYVGSPLKGDKEFLYPGQYVGIQRHSDTEVMIEGESFYRLRQRNVLFTIKNKSKHETTV